MTQVLFSTISLFQFASPFEGVQISDFIKRPSAASNIVLREFQGDNPRAEPCALAVEVPDPIRREIEDRASHPEISEGRSLDSMDCGELSWRYWITFARIAGKRRATCIVTIPLQLGAASLPRPSKLTVLIVELWGLRGMG